jgi:hypothetical protein
LHGLALTQAERAGDRYQRTRAHAGLGDAWAGTDPARAREHWEIAMALFAELGVPERAEVERRLADLDHGRPPPKVPRRLTALERSTRNLHRALP